MTDRHAGYVITLAENIREDDSQATIAAIKQIKGVLDVTPVINDPGMMIAEVRAGHEFRDKLVATFFKVKQEPHSR
jgi:hypothetical protein